MRARAVAVAEDCSPRVVKIQTAMTMAEELHSICTVAIDNVDLLGRGISSQAPQAPQHCGFLRGVHEHGLHPRPSKRHASRGDGAAQRLGVGDISWLTAVTVCCYNTTRVPVPVRLQLIFIPRSALHSAQCVLLVVERFGFSGQVPIGPVISSNPGL